MLCLVLSDRILPCTCLIPSLRYVCEVGLCFCLSSEALLYQGSMTRIPAEVFQHFPRVFVCFHFGQWSCPSISHLSAFWCLVSYSVTSNAISSTPVLQYVEHWELPILACRGPCAAQAKWASGGRDMVLATIGQILYPSLWGCYPKLLLSTAIILASSIPR